MVDNVIPLQLPVPSSKTSLLYDSNVQFPLSRLGNCAVNVITKTGSGDAVYPLFVAEVTPSRHGSPYILVSGGVHGDEPAGVHAAVRFLRDIAPRYSDRFGFVVFPCVNPTGFSAGTLETMSGANLNRLFGIDRSVPEIASIQKWLYRSGRRFRLTFDLHEVRPDYLGEGFGVGDNPRGCYLYETTRETCKRIGRKLIAGLPEGVEVCQWPEIYLDENCGGVISYPEACRNRIYAEGGSLDAYLQRHYTSHSFTTETPTGWALERRIETHLLWLERAIQIVSGDSV